MTSYRYYKLAQASTSQIDIGGFFKGDKLGLPTSVASRPQQPWYYVAGLTTNVTSNLTNDFHYSYLRNYWSWADQNAPPQIAGLGGALEPFGETASSSCALQRQHSEHPHPFLGRSGQLLRDDLTLLKGNHLITFGGQYQHNFNFHQRSDNGGGINFTPTYQLGQSGGTGVGNVDLSDLLAHGYPSGSTASRVAAAALGIVTAAQVAYTRSGPNAGPEPASDTRIRSEHHPLLQRVLQRHLAHEAILYAELWHGLDAGDAPDRGHRQTDRAGGCSRRAGENSRLPAQNKAAALKGQVYNPELGFALVGNVGNGGTKYPYNPFYGSFSPTCRRGVEPAFRRRRHRKQNLRP